LGCQQGASVSALCQPQTVMVCSTAGTALKALQNNLSGALSQERNAKFRLHPVSTQKSEKPIEYITVYG